jgi:hypothetical protein
VQTQGSAAVTNDTITRFDRDTGWLATGVLVILVFAALVIAIKERQPKVTPTERDPLPKANSKVGSMVANSSNADGKMTPASGSGVDHAFIETPLQKIPSSQMEPAASTPASVPAFTPEIHRNAHRQDSARVRGPKARNARDRSSVASRSDEVKRRLIALWHQSLANTEKSRSCATFSNLNTGVNKNAAYTAGTNH